MNSGGNLLRAASTAVAFTCSSSLAVGLSGARTNPKPSDIKSVMARPPKLEVRKIKASDAIWQLLLGILDKATLTLGDNCRVDFSQTLIFLTSNLGGRAITDLMSDGFWFVRAPDKPTAKLDEQVKATAVEAARRRFPPGFMNRLGKIVEVGA